MARDQRTTAEVLQSILTKAQAAGRVCPADAPVNEPAPCESPAAGEVRNFRTFRPSSRAIAEMCGVSHPFVAGLQPQVETVTTCPSGDTPRTGRDGKQYPASRREAAREPAQEPGPMPALGLQELLSRESLWDLEDIAGLRRERLPAVALRLRSLVVNQTKRGVPIVELRTSALAKRYGCSDRQVRRCTQLLLAIGYLEETRRSAGRTSLVKLGWGDRQELADVAAKLRAVHPRRVRVRSGFGPGSVRLQTDTKAPQPERTAHVGAGLNGAPFQGRKDLRRERAEKSIPATAPPRISLKSLTTEQRARYGKRLQELAPRLVAKGVDPGMIHAILKRAGPNGNGLETIVAKFSQAAYATDIRNAGGWLRRAVRERAP